MASPRRRADDRGSERAAPRRPLTLPGLRLHARHRPPGCVDSQSRCRSRSASHGQQRGDLPIDVVQPDADQASRHTCGQPSVPLPVAPVAASDARAPSYCGARCYRGAALVAMTARLRSSHRRPGQRSGQTIDRRADVYSGTRGPLGLRLARAGSPGSGQRSRSLQAGRIVRSAAGRVARMPTTR